MKLITIAGNIGKDAELRKTQNGDSVASFSVAVSDRKKETTWFDVSLWGKRAEGLHSYIKKGGQITVMGDLQTREHEGKTYLQISALEVTLQGGRSDSRTDDNSQGSYANRDEQSGRDPVERGGAFDEDDIPFSAWIH